MLAVATDVLDGFAARTRMSMFPKMFSVSLCKPSKQKLGKQKIIFKMNERCYDNLLNAYEKCGKYAGMCMCTE